MSGRLESLATLALAATAIVVAGSFAHTALTTPARSEERGTRATVDEALWHESVSLGQEVLGGDSSIVAMVVFADLQCPACRAFHQEVISHLAATYPWQVRVLYLPFPLAYHTQARPAAEATECAAAQVELRTWYDVLFEHQDALATRSFLSFASEIASIDSVAFDDCLSSGAGSPRIERSLAVGQQLEIPGTPSVAIDRVLVSIPPRVHEVDSSVRLAIQRDARRTATRGAPTARLKSRGMN